MLTTREIAAATDLPIETARRYLRHFADYCPATRDGRRYLYDGDVVQVLLTARAMYLQGRTTDEIRQTLSHHHPTTIPAEVIAPDLQEVIALLPHIRAVVEGQQLQIDTLAAEVERLREEVKRSEIRAARMDEERREMNGEVDELREEVGEMRMEREKGFWGRLRLWLR